MSPIGDRNGRDSGADQKNSKPAEGGNPLSQKEKCGKGSQNIADGGKRNDIRDVGYRKELHQNPEMEGFKGGSDEDLRRFDHGKQKGERGKGVSGESRNGSQAPFDQHKPDRLGEKTGKKKSPELFP